MNVNELVKMMARKYLIEDPNWMISTTFFTIKDEEPKNHKVWLTVMDLISNEFQGSVLVGKDITRVEIQDVTMNIRETIDLLNYTDEEAKKKFTRVFGLDK
jgi:hypothetical protein